MRLSNTLHLRFRFTSMVPLPQPGKPVWFRLFRFRSPLLTESLRFLFLRLLRCFTSAGVAHTGLYIHPAVTGFEAQPGFPIRKSTDQRVLPPPRGLSQVTTSFIASWRQGIHLEPFVAYHKSCRWFHCSNALQRNDFLTNLFAVPDCQRTGGLP